LASFGDSPEEPKKCMVRCGIAIEKFDDGEVCANVSGLWVGFARATMS